MMDDEKHWQFKHALNTRTGETTRFYTYKRKPCKRVELSSHLAQQLAGYTLIEKDLRSVLIWLEKIEELHYDRSDTDEISYGHSSDRETYNLVKGLFVSALTFYGKCFTSCAGRRAKIDRKQVSDLYKNSHDELMKFRHNFAAHSGDEKLEEVRVALVLPLKAGKALPKIYCELNQPDVLWGKSSDGVSFKSLVEHVQSIALTKINTLSKKILQEEVLPKGEAFWLKK